MRINPTVLFFAAIVTSTSSFTPNLDAGTTPSGACGLVTRQQAAAALGAAVPAGVEKTADLPLQGGSVKAQYCFYGSEVLIARFDLGKTAPTLFKQYRESLESKSDYETVTGVGDDAFHAKGQIAVRKGQTGLIIDVGQNRGGGAAELRKEKGLAALAVAHL
jgi:hypothetical protein